MGDTYFRVRHPSATHGKMTVTYRVREGLGRDSVEHDRTETLEVDDSIVNISEKQGGKQLVDYLVRHEGFKDLSKYPAIPEAPKDPIKPEVGWVLAIPHASDDNKVTGSTSVSLQEGQHLPLEVVDNLVTTDSKAVRDALLASGFTIRKVITE